MPVYHFKVIDGVACPDLDGTELPDLYAAQAEAIRLSGGILSHWKGALWNGVPWRLKVTDAGGHIRLVLRFSPEILSAAPTP